MLLPTPKQVTYQSTNQLHVARDWFVWLDQNVSIAAFDFEAAAFITEAERTELKSTLKVMQRNPVQFKFAIARITDQLRSHPLSHPSRSVLTHISVAISDTEAFVVILDSDTIRKFVLNWLVTTQVTQIWHNLTYDGSHIYHHTGRFPKRYEDTQIFAKTLLNHVDTFKANTGLKELAGYHYGSWAVSDDNFDLAHMYDEKLILYAATDACATFFLWQQLCDTIADEPPHEGTDIIFDGKTYAELMLDPPSTDTDYSPHDLLPMPAPMTDRPPDGFFYHYVAKHLITTTIRVAMTGVPIDMERVAHLEAELDAVLQSVTDRLAANPIIQAFQEQQYSKAWKQFESEVRSKMRTPDHWLKPFDPKSMEHRSYYMQILTSSDPLCIPPPDTIATGIPKWTARDVTKYGSALDNPDIQQQAALEFAKAKADIYNQSYHAKLKHTAREEILPPFNPASPDQKHALLTDYLGFESDKLTDAYIVWEKQRKWDYANTGRYPDPPKNKFSWNRDNIERINRETDDPDIKDLTQAMIDHSFGAIVRNNFINAFYEYTINDRLLGKYKLYGTKTMRMTSNSPNMLQMPSTGSVYAKPVKKVFIAPPGYLVWTIDYSALENRIIANLSKDENLSNIYLQGLDGHCMNSLYYFKEEIAKHIDLTGDPVVDTRNYFEATSTIPELKAIRQKGKAPSFGMQYGAHPPKVASSIKCSIEEAEQIFHRYHYELYPGVSKFRDEYVTPTIKQDKRIHMGMGAYIKSDRPDKDIRTITNSCSQFWSILTLLSLDKLYTEIDKHQLQDITEINSTIYDSLYGIVRADPESIKWLNDTIVPIMQVKFISDMVVPNEASLEIGTTWADLSEIPNNATLDQITQIMEDLC